jgi:hypothetical protein
VRGISACPTLRLESYHGATTRNPLFPKDCPNRTDRYLFVWSCQSLPLGAATFRVMDPEGAEVIGHSRYELSRRRNDLLIGRGQARFNDGEHDVEYDTLKERPGQGPTMLTLDHKFYNADGSMQREIVADFRTGQTSCTSYEDGEAQTNSAKIEFTPDSYGGSAVVLPLQQSLAHGSSEPVRLHALNCLPKPRLIAVIARVRQPSKWIHYPGQTVEVDVTPDLGWLDAVVAPFLPRLRAWFDPSDNWALAGGEFSRYFRGPRILLVRELPSEFRSAVLRKEGGGN